MRERITEGQRALRLSLRDVRLRVAITCLDRRPADPPVVPCSVVFALREGKIGDFVVASACFRELKRQYPEARIAVISAPSTAFLARNHARVDETIVATPRSWWSAMRLVARARGRFDAFVDLSEILRPSDIFTTRMIGASFNALDARHALQLNTVPIVARGRNTTHALRSLLEALGVARPDMMPDWPTPITAASTAQRALDGLGLPLVGINPFGSVPSRSFDASYLSQLIAQVRQRMPGASVVMIVPRYQSARFARWGLSGQGTAFRPVEVADIYESTAVIERLNLLLSPDTALTHIAAARRVPQIVFFTYDRENLSRWRPDSRLVLVLEAPEVPQSCDSDVRQIPMAEVDRALRTVAAAPTFADGVQDFSRQPA